MLLVVFGAGASYDSAPDYPAQTPRGQSLDLKRPPLAKDLFALRFNEELKRYRKIKHLSTRLRPRDGHYLEQELARLRDDAKEDQDRYGQLVAVRFYLREIILRSERQWTADIDGITNYANLIERLRPFLVNRLPRPVCFVTFNYDTLIEHGLQEVVGFEFTKLQDYVSNDRFKLFKLHGSTTWLHATSLTSPFLEYGLAVQRMIDHAADIGPTGQYAFTSSGDSCWIEHNLALPALAIPVENGKDFECPEWHRKELEKLLPSVTHILTIGWRGREDHFLGLLRRCTAIQRGLVVSGSAQGAEEIANHLVKSGVRSPIVSFEGGFSQFCQSDSLEKFLFVPHRNWNLKS